MKIYDSIIIGGGPAGLTSAIYLQRYNRSTLIIDKEEGRWDTYELNENYLGFPEGIHAKQLRELGRKQAIKFGAKYKIDEVSSIERCESDEYFEVCSKNDKYFGKTIIIATGVRDLFPSFNDLQSYLGKSLFWCITCDGHKTIDKKVLLIGDTDDAACTCLQFLNYTNKLEFLTNCTEEECLISEKWLKRLADKNIKVHYSGIKHVKGENGYFRSIELENGTTIETDFIFNEQGAIPNSTLAKELGVKVDDNGYIFTDHEQRTNIPFVYAAGDVTKLFAHQIVTAAHEGATAGITANYDLYKPEQKID